MRGIYNNRLTSSELSLRLLSWVLTILFSSSTLAEPMLLSSSALWTSDGENSQAVVVQRSCLQHLLEKSRDAILIQESLALIRKPKQSVTIQPRKLSLRWQHRRLGRPSSQPRPTAQRPPSGLSRSSPCVIARSICTARAAPCRPHPRGPCAPSFSRSVL